MLSYKVEILILVLLIIILPFCIKPIVVNIYMNYLPTNLEYSLEECIDQVVFDLNSYDYITKDDYLYVVEYTSEGEKYIKEHYLFKGITSGYVPTYLTYGTGDGVKRRAINLNVNDTNYMCNVKRHNENYIIEFIYKTEDNSMVNEKGNELDVINRKNYSYFFDVIGGDYFDYEIYCINDKDSFLILDYNDIREAFSN